MQFLLTILFDNGLARLALAGAALASCVSLYSCDQRNIGAAEERAKIERQADENAQKADAVRDASMRGDAASVPDPWAATTDGGQ